MPDTVFRRTTPDGQFVITRSEDTILDNEIFVNLCNVLEDNEIRFSGTYTACLIYIGARSVGSGDRVARQYASGFYV